MSSVYSHTGPTVSEVIRPTSCLSASLDHYFSWSSQKQLKGRDVYFGYGLRAHHGSRNGWSYSSRSLWHNSSISWQICKQRAWTQSSSHSQGPPSVTHFCYLGHRLPKYHWPVETEGSNTGAWGGHFVKSFDAFTPEAFQDSLYLENLAILSEHKILLRK